MQTDVGVKLIPLRTSALANPSCQYLVAGLESFESSQSRMEQVQDQKMEYCVCAVRVLNVAEAVTTSISSLVGRKSRVVPRKSARCNG